ncbi:hypothetical protein DMR_10370 [Solidesulfovibrio magneticus RS-1]|uniref:Uncharacterized protein n=1 Tax=Solidesulfovibrio magneticus (strain ATCC 700980 / DSM 13731 / RS-1) TaxID=573370 RepID=C4XKY9_SOLM1|nr:hypothetical protein DMR_10370 [Solidesulfovibrio magneticus RS-1]
MVDDISEQNHTCPMAGSCHFSPPIGGDFLDTAYISELQDAAFSVDGAVKLVWTDLRNDIVFCKLLLSIDSVFGLVMASD